MMPSHHFISYSAADGADFAQRLADALEAGPPSYSAWIFQRKLIGGLDWHTQLAEAVQNCETFLFLLTRDSVTDSSTCKNEWTHALAYKKPIIPLRVQRDAVLPFRINTRQFIDFSGSFDSALAQLRQRLQWQASPAGELQTLKDRRADAQRDLNRASDDAQRARIADEIKQLQAQIAEQERIVRDPAGAARRTEESIQRGLERERQPEKPVGGKPFSRFINSPPGIAPTYFQDRFVESKLAGDFLKNDSRCLLAVVGRAGIGKTALVCRVLKSLEGGQLPDANGALRVGGIVYLNGVVAQDVSVPKLYADLLKLLPAESVGPLDALYKNPQVSTSEKMRALLAAFSDEPVVVLLDNFESVMDGETFAIRDAELDEALRALVNAPPHRVKVVITTRVAPRELLLAQPARTQRLNLDEGLESPFAENILRELDADGKVGLRDAPDALLSQARERTRGYPRALEALFAILANDRDTTLPEMLAGTLRTLPDNVVRALVGEAFERLDNAAAQVMQALAVYGRPVTPSALDFLLQPYRVGVNSAPVLNRLVNMYFARREGGRYFLHPADAEYALTRIATEETPTPTLPRYAGEGAQNRPLSRWDGGGQGGGSDVWTQRALYARAADYFAQTRTPREDWKTLDDLVPQLAEFDLRCAAGDYDTAASVLLEIDGDYLLLWGHYRLMAELHERLQDKLNDATLKEFSLSKLGSAYAFMGQTRKAISYQQQALDIAQLRNDRGNEAVCLGNLGNRYAELGQTARASEYYEQALAFAREIGDRAGEGNHLGNLGNRYAELGETARAIEYYEQALAIAREMKNRQAEGTWLGSLGNAYADLDQTARAIEYYEQALAIDREIGDRSGEGADLENLAMALIDECRYSEAISNTSECIKIGREIASPRHGSWGNYRLALAHLYACDLPAARAAAEAARQYDVPEDNHSVLALLGVIALRQGDSAAARTAFASAVQQADVMLERSAQNYMALDAKALALCGLAVLDPKGFKNPSGPAVATYRAARAINRDAGVVARVLRLLDALALADGAAEVVAEVKQEVQWE